MGLRTLLGGGWVLLSSTPPIPSRGAGTHGDPPIPIISTRLAMLSNNLTHWKKLPLLPSLTNQPHQVLASEPIPFTDLQQVRSEGSPPTSQPSDLSVPNGAMGLADPPLPPFLPPQVSRIAAYAFSALSQIRVDAKEELVVQFGIP